MEQANGAVVTEKPLPDLGTVICKYCGNVLFTLPTNGVKKIYGVCKDNCQDKDGE